MKVHQKIGLRPARCACRMLAAASTATALLLSGIATSPAPAAINWVSLGETTGGNPTGHGTQWWFDPYNWSRHDPGDVPDDPPGLLLPPNNALGTGPDDLQINEGTADLPGGEGVVYDPENDPHFEDALSLHFPEGFGPQTIWRTYISRNTTNHNLLTIRGDLEITDIFIVGRSGSTGTSPEQQNLGRVNQESGHVKLPLPNMDIGNYETSGWGNGIYDYRGGILEVSVDGTGAVRIAHGSSSGTSGHGRFIMRNPDSDGYVRAWNFQVASHAGIPGNPAQSADGITRGVATVEFHYANGGTRPIQVLNNLSINNGADEVGTRSSRLELILDEEPIVNGMGAPNDLGLFATGIDPFSSGAVTGSGDMGGRFSNADGSILYEQDSIVSAAFGNTLYNWTISYSGSITWSDLDSSTVASISGVGGDDVVLIGHSSEALPGIAGDFNGDGIVDAADYTVWRDGLGTEFQPEDFQLWKDNFGATSPGAAAALGLAAVPEPASAGLMLAALVGLLALRRRGR